MILLPNSTDGARVSSAEPREWEQQSLCGEEIIPVIYYSVLLGLGLPGKAGTGWGGRAPLPHCAWCCSGARDSGLPETQPPPHPRGEGTGLAAVRFAGGLPSPGDSPSGRVERVPPPCRRHQLGWGPSLELAGLHPGWLGPPDLGGGCARSNASCRPCASGPGRGRDERWAGAVQGSGSPSKGCPHTGVWEERRVPRLRV